MSLEGGREGRGEEGGGEGRERRGGGKRGGRGGREGRDDCYTYSDGTTILLEWTTSLDSGSGTLICPSLCPRHVGRNNYVPLFGVDPIEWRLTRYYVIRDVIVIFEC